MSRLAASGANAAAALAPAEVAEMKEHLAFLRSYKDVLRLKLNAAEDLLVNGRREPTDRGVCHHLLGKIDRAVIESAVGREPLRSDPAARARMLAGAIRLTADVGVLLAYLETLAHVRSHAEAAEAFAEVVRRIDFEALSPTRLGRLLQVLIETFAEHERVQVLFSLFAMPAFRRAYDAAEPTLPSAVAAIFAPLRAVHRRLLEDGPPAREGAAAASAPLSASARDGELLAAGIAQVLAAPDPVLRAYAEPLRAGILEIALAPSVPPAVADRAAGVLLASLARAGKTYGRFAIRRASQLLARHADDRARAVLDELHRAQPGSNLAVRWLSALDARRVGRIAVQGNAGEGRLAPAFWLDGQRPVWVRTAGATSAERLAEEARLQDDLALPGIATVVEHGVASGIPYVAVAGAGRPLVGETVERLDPAAALVLAAAAARLLRALALAGVAMPDAEPVRFLCSAESGVLVLADLDGARAGDPDAAARAHAVLACALTARLLGAERAARLVPLAEVLARAPAADLCELVRALDSTALRTERT